MTEREKMLAGGWFDPRDAELTAIRDNATRLMHRLNVELCGHDDAYRAAMERVVFNDRLDAALCALFMGVVLSVLVYSVKAVLAARRNGRPTTQETAFVPLPAGQHA